MKLAFVLLVGSAAACSFANKAAAVENARDLASSCHSLERGAKGTGRQIRIPNTKAALLCWGYMQAMQDVSVLIDENGRRLIGSCPPERITLLRLIRSFSTYARSHSEKSQGNAAVAVINAFQEAFPCHRETASSEKLFSGPTAAEGR
jgi:hypothetical protein